MQSNFSLESSQLVPLNNLPKVERNKIEAFIILSIIDLSKTNSYFNRYRNDLDAFAMSICCSKEFLKNLQLYKGPYIFTSIQLTPHYTRGDSDYKLTVTNSTTNEIYSTIINYSDY